MIGDLFIYKDYNYGFVLYKEMGSYQGLIDTFVYIEIDYSSKKIRTNFREKYRPEDLMFKEHIKINKRQAFIALFEV